VQALYIGSTNRKSINIKAKQEDFDIAEKE